MYLYIPRSPVPVDKEEKKISQICDVMYSFTILQSMKCKESALCFRNVLFDSNIAKTPAESNFYFSIYPNQVDLIVKLFSQNQTEGGSRYDLKDLISTVKFHKQTVILSHSMCSSKQCDMHFLLQILEIRNFVVGGEMTDRILLLLRVLGVLSLCRSCWVRDLLLPEHTFCHPHPIPHFHPHPHLQPHPHCLKSDNKTYFFMPGINPDTCPITPPAIL